jgi:hypothetical protein
MIGVLPMTIMSHRGFKAVPALLLLLLCVLLAGCVGFSFGDVNYQNGALHIPVFNAGDERDVIIQVTVHSIDNLRQVEIDKTAEWVTLKKGENEYTLPIDLSPGTYKLYLYVLIDGKREVCEIRDIGV